MDQEVDCNAARSTSADVAAAWTNGFGANAVGNSPPATTAVFDKSMIFECKSLAFSPLSSDVMLAVYSNGAVPQPNLTNLRFQKSGANGTDECRGPSGDGSCFRATRRSMQTTGPWFPSAFGGLRSPQRDRHGSRRSEIRRCVNSWTPMSPAPPAYGAGQAFKSGAGLFGATDGTNIWLFSVNTDRPIRFSTADSTDVVDSMGDGSWRRQRHAVTKLHFRCSTRRQQSVGLIWTEGTTNFEVMSASLTIDATSPTVSILHRPTAPRCQVGGRRVGNRLGRRRRSRRAIQKLDSADLSAVVTLQPLHDDVETPMPARAALSDADGRRATRQTTQRPLPP
jgi:hypothetical protein